MPSTIQYVAHPLIDLPAVYRRRAAIEREKRDAAHRRRPPHYHRKVAVHDALADAWLHAAEMLEAAMKAERVENVEALLNAPIR